MPSMPRRDPTTTVPRPRTTSPLSRERIVAAAIDLADRDGADGLSHAPARPGARRRSDVAVPPRPRQGRPARCGRRRRRRGGPAGDRRRGLEGVAARDDPVRPPTLRAHPWAPSVIGSRSEPTRAMLAYMDTVLGIFHEGGFSVELAHHAVHVLGSRVLGFSQDLFVDSSDPTPDPETSANLARQLGCRLPARRLARHGRVPRGRARAVRRRCRVPVRAGPHPRWPGASVRGESDLSDLRPGQRVRCRTRLDLYKSRLVSSGPMHAFDVLGDPVRRRILELLADGELTSGAVTGGRPGGVRDLAAGRVAAPQGPARQRVRDGPARGRAAALRRRRRAVPGARRLARATSAASGSSDSTRSRPSSPAGSASAACRAATDHRKETTR